MSLERTVVWDAEAGSHVSPAGKVPRKKVPNFETDSLFGTQHRFQGRANHRPQNESLHMQVLLFVPTSSSPLLRKSITTKKGQNNAPQYPSSLVFARVHRIDIFRWFVGPGRGQDESWAGLSLQHSARVTSSSVKSLKKHA